MKFRATILQAGKTATGVEVPAKIVEGLGTSKKPKVEVTFKGFAYRTSIAVMGGKFMLPISADVRKSAGVAAGDTVEIVVENDTAPREVTVPPDFAAELEKSPEAKRRFAAMAYSHQLRHVLAIEGAKAAETRQRRIDGAIAMLLKDKS
jgi:bifunctional DNA-binding transcriptional regulator/antitoxin component of YhaV-PrlF toxin-antitoxin module